MGQLPRTRGFGGKHQASANKESYCDRYRDKEIPKDAPWNRPMIPGQYAGLRCCPIFHSGHGQTRGCGGDARLSR